MISLSNPSFAASLHPMGDVSHAITNFRSVFKPICQRLRSLTTSGRGCLVILGVSTGPADQRVPSWWVARDDCQQTMPTIHSPGEIESVKWPSM